MTNATARKSKGGDADELERMIHAWTKAVHARDADAAVADYADDVRNFDLAPPLQHGGRKTIRDNQRAGRKRAARPEDRDRRRRRLRPLFQSHPWQAHGRQRNQRVDSPDAVLSQDRRRLEGHARTHVGAVLHGRLVQSGGRLDALTWRRERSPNANTRKTSANKGTTNKTSSNKT